MNQSTKALGCMIGYLMQAGVGQMELFNRAQPIADVIRNPRTDAPIVRLLSEIDAIKKFGESQGLKPTGNFKDYVALDRDAVVSVVTAVKPLSFETKTWSFPLVGSFTYLGWFDPKRAQSFGDELRSEGWDVDVRGARAYSTLGWFKDPVISTMLKARKHPRVNLVNVILHESVHTTFYIDGQSTFNESLADFVADEMTAQYFKNESETWAPYLESKKEDDEWAREFHQAYGELEKIYSSTRSDAEKLGAKTDLLNALKARLKVNRPINNATLVGYKTYQQGHGVFEKLWVATGKDWAEFWKRIKTLNAKSFPKEQMSEVDGVVGSLLGF